MGQLPLLPDQQAVQIFTCLNVFLLRPPFRCICYFFFLFPVFRTLEQDIHQEFESLSMTFQMLSMRMGRVGQREITNFAYSARFHPSLGKEPRAFARENRGKLGS